MVLLRKLMEDFFMTDPVEAETLPIENLVRSRRCELGLSSVELTRRCGYKNTSKGLRRLQQLCSGEFDRAAGLIRWLPNALQIPASLVDRAVETSKRQIHEAQEAAWRAAFKPHAIILTEKRVPQPIFLAVLIGVDTLVRVDFDLAADRMSFVNHALDGICAKLTRWNPTFDRLKAVGSYPMPAFGRPTGFVINYATDRGVRFDLNGNALEVLPRAYRVGDAQLLLSGRKDGAGALRKIVGLG